jgi:hypothetical protein
VTLGEALLAAGDAQGFTGLLTELEAKGGAELGVAVLRAERAVHDGAHDEARAILDGELAAQSSAPVVARVAAWAAFRAGRRGAALDNLVDAALAADPFCIRTRGVERARALRQWRGVVFEMATGA